MRLGWVCFLPASTAVAASLPVGDIVGALLFGKGLHDFGCGTSETDSEYSICQVFSPPRRMPGLRQGEDTRQPQYESGAERLWTIVVIVDCGQASITVFGDTPIDAGQDREVQAAQNLVFEFRLATR